MRIDVAIPLIAGVFVMASVALGYWVNPWFAFTAFVGFYLCAERADRLVPDDVHSEERGNEGLSTPRA